MEGLIKLMDIQTARAILSEVASGGWLDKELPEDEKDLIDLAQYYVDEAKIAKQEGMDNESILAIINLAQASPPVLSAPVEPDSLEGPPGEIDVYYKGNKYPSLTENKNDDVVDLAREDKDYEGLPLPQPIPETALDMPVDITDLGDKAVRRLYSAFGSYLGRSRWKLATAESSLSNATYLRDAEYRKLYGSISKTLARNGERATKDLVDSLAKEEDTYKEWDEKVQKHTEQVIHWKALKDIYGGNVERLSREWTMRTEQYERER